jgi:poly(3-hydroxybutyrate) depolymerase
LTRWLIAEVPEHFGAIATLASECGFVASIFGSVVKEGSGRDMDVLMKASVDTPRNERRFLAGFGGTIQRKRRNTETQILSYEVEKDGRLYHFVFGEIHLRRAGTWKKSY